MTARAYAAVIAAAAILLLGAGVAVSGSSDADTGDAPEPTPVGPAVYAVSGTGSCRLAILPGPTESTCSTSITWIIIADGEVSVTMDGGEDVKYTVSGVSKLATSIPTGSHSFIWTLPDGTQEFHLKTGSAAYTWTEDGSPEGSWMSNAALDDHDRTLVLAATAAALISCGLIIAYYMIRRSDAVEDVI